MHWLPNWNYWSYKIGWFHFLFLKFLNLIYVVKYYFNNLKTPIKGPVHNYDPHNFDDLYADEYGGYGSGMSSNFRDGNGRFDRGGIFYFNLRN
jgi:hypothetical protein